MIVPHLASHGWNAEVLAVHPKDIAAPNDPWLAERMEDYAPIHRVRALGLRWGRVPGLRGLATRAYRSLCAKGDDLLRSRKFDLVYFTSRLFSTFYLGCRWKKRYGIPFVVDYHDPWVNDFYTKHPTARPPGGRWKYAVAQSIARFLEPKVLIECAGITAVSPAYIQQLEHRYPDLPKKPTLVAPFPFSMRDFERAREHSITQDIFTPNDGFSHWIYIGAAGDSMRFSASSLLSAMANWRQRNPNVASRIKMHFIGTSYAPPGQGIPTIAPLAKQFGLADLVHESTDRIPFGTMLKCLSDADALIVITANDPTYSASKVLPYLVARKPTLVITHRNGPTAALLSKTRGATVVAYDESDTLNDVARMIDLEWLTAAKYQRVTEICDQAIRIYRDDGHAKQLADFFSSILDA